MNSRTLQRQLIILCFACHTVSSELNTINDYNPKHNNKNLGLIKRSVMFQTYIQINII